MALDAGFVVAVLEGIAGTLDEVIERLDNAELKASLDVLQTRVTALRVSIEPPASEPEGNEESEEPIPAEAITRLFGLVEPANAADEVKEAVDFVTHAPGGHGAVRELALMVLKATGRWEKALDILHTRNFHPKSGH